MSLETTGEVDPVIDMEYVKNWLGIELYNILVSLIVNSESEYGVPKEPRGYGSWILSDYIHPDESFGFPGNCRNDNNLDNWCMRQQYIAEWLELQSDPIADWIMTYEI